MNKILLTTVLIASLLSGCASVPLESSTKATEMKELKAPSDNTAGIYVYRKDTFVGQALKKDVLIDGKCVGETARGVFFYKEVEGDKEHTLSTESEFSNNDIKFITNTGEFYFFEQQIKMGAFVGGAILTNVTKLEGRKQISKLKLAKQGQCGG